MGNDEYRAAVAAFIRANGITRCPTACALPTQGTVAATDRAALEDYAVSRTQTRHKRGPHASGRCGPARLLSGE
jgi:hypothetical protein